MKRITLMCLLLYFTFVFIKICSTSASHFSSLASTNKKCCECCPQCFLEVEKQKKFRGCVLRFLTGSIKRGVVALAGASKKASV